MCVFGTRPEAIRICPPVNELKKRAELEVVCVTAQHCLMPDVVPVHGDTATTFVTAPVCFCLQIPGGHAEAGLRTCNIYSPYPEEFNRQAVSIVSRYNFAPTQLAADPSQTHRFVLSENTSGVPALEPGSAVLTHTAYQRKREGEDVDHV